MVVVTNTSIVGAPSIDDDLFRRMIMIYSAPGGKWKTNWQLATKLNYKPTSFTAIS